MRRTTEESNLYSGVSSVPIKPSGADQKPSEEEKPSEDEKPLEETPVEDGGPAAHKENIKALQKHALEVKRKYFLTFCLLFLFIDSCGSKKNYHWF